LVVVVAVVVVEVVVAISSSIATIQVVLALITKSVSHERTH
jgi:hypothetical protein